MSILIGRAHPLHPKNTPEVLVNFSRAMALGAARKELSHVGLLYASKDELIAPAAAAGACLSMHISANRSDFSLLLEHGLPSKRQVKLTCHILWENSPFENTEEVG